MSTQTVKQADVTFILAHPDLSDLAAIQQMVEKATKTESFSHLVQQMNAEAAHHTSTSVASPLSKAKGFDLGLSATGGSSGGKPSGSGTVTLTIHF